MLTLKDIRAAYKKTKIEPKTDTFFKMYNGKICAGCILTAMYCQKHGTNKVTMKDILAWADEEYGFQGASMIIDGFDGGFPKKNPYHKVAREFRDEILSKEQ